MEMRDIHSSPKVMAVFYIVTFDKFPFPAKASFLAVIHRIIITLESLKKYRFSNLNPLCTRI